MIKKLGIIILALFMLAGVTGCENKEKEEKDPLIKEVDEAIADFLEIYAEDYVNEETLDYYVISAISALEESGYDVKLTDFISKDDVKTYYENEEYDSISKIFKALLNLKAFNVDNSNVVSELNKVTEVDIYSYSYGLIALKNANINNQLREDILSKINVIREEDYRDADYAGVSLMALGNDDITKEPFYTLINDSLTKDGINAWGSPSSSSTANVILGLLSQGIDPRNEEYTTEGTNLIQALLKYEENGAFKNNIDQEIDLMFATPQGFAALVAFKMYYNNNKPFNLFLS